MTKKQLLTELEAITDDVEILTEVAQGDYRPIQCLFLAPDKQTGRFVVAVLGTVPL